MAYISDATLLEPGSIVKVQSPLSSSAKPTYPHFFVVLATPDVVKPGSVFPLVGISSRIDRHAADPAKHVAMKWLARRGGDPETGFDTACHACMDFAHVLEAYRGTVFPLEVAAEDRGKFIRADKLKTIIAKMNAWMRRRT